MRISKSKLFLLGNLFFIGGIGLASIMPPEIRLYKFWFFAVVLFFILNLVIFWSNKKIAVAALLAALLFVGIWRYTVSWPAGVDNQSLLAEKKSYIGRIIKEPDIRSNSQKLTVEINDSNNELPAGRVLLTSDLYPKFNYGELISFECRLERPESFNDFAYDRYLAKDGVYYVCYYPSIKKIGQGEKNRVMSLVYRIKDQARQLISKGLREPAAGLTKAIILGDKKEIQEDLREKFSRTGLAHMMAISGMHISILILMLTWVLIFIGLTRKLSFYIVLGFLILYIILVGMPSSALRAGLMGFLLLFAWQIGRINKISSSLLLAASIMLIVNPKLMRDDIGWQLSFLAVWGIIWFYPLLRNFWQNKGWPRLGVLGDILLVSLSVQIMIWPVLAYYFSYISLISIIANLLVVWLLPLIIGFGLAAIFLSFVVGGWENILFLPLEIFFSYLISVTSILSALPFGVIEANDFPIIFYFAYYFLVVVFYLRVTKPSKAN